MGGPIQARTTIIPSSYCTPYGLWSYDMAPTKGRWKHSGYNAESETNDDPKTRHESHSGMLQNHSHSSNGDGDRPTTAMDPTSNQSSSINHTHAITLSETSHSRMANERSTNKNRLHPISVKSRKYTATISIYMRKNRDNRALYPTTMVDANRQNKNRVNQKRRERPARQNPDASRRHSNNNIYRWIGYREQNWRGGI